MQILANGLQIPVYAEANWFEPSHGTNSISSGPGDIDASDSILEHGLHQAADLNLHTFAAITETGPGVELGAEATEEASLHVVIGRW